MNSLEEKTLHEIRGIAQSFGITDIFEKDIKQLSQEIRLKQQSLIPQEVKLPEPPKYDASLMTQAPAQQASPESIVNMLEPYIKLGLRLNLSEERWQMSVGNKTDEGTMRMPLIHVLRCAQKIMK